MPFSRVKDMLNRAIEFHQMLVNFYSKAENASEKESVRLLTEYMVRREKVLKEQLSQIAGEQTAQIVEGGVKYEPEFATCRCFEDLKIDKHSSVDDVIDAGLKLNQCLINLYHQLAEMAPVEGVKALFSNLETMEIAEKKKLARMKGVL